MRTGDAESAARMAALLLLAEIMKDDRPVRLAVPGGRTPARIFERLAAHRSAWNRTTILFADERAVPPDDPESNAGLVQEKLVKPLGAQAPRVVRMRGEAADLEEAAREYAREFETPPTLVLLGIGEDGHVASLFPHSPLLDETGRRVAVVLDSPKPPPRRITITPRVLREAGQVIVVATGAGKREAVTRALLGETDPAECPARLVRDRYWIVDAEAGADLPETLLQPMP